MYARRLLLFSLILVVVFLGVTGIYWERISKGIILPAASRLITSVFEVGFTVEEVEADFPKLLLKEVRVSSHGSFTVEVALLELSSLTNLFTGEFPTMTTDKVAATLNLSASSDMTKPQPLDLSSLSVAVKELALQVVDASKRDFLINDLTMHDGAFAAVLTGETLSKKESLQCFIDGTVAQEYTVDFECKGVLKSNFHSLLGFTVIPDFVDLAAAHDVRGAVSFTRNGEVTVTAQLPDALLTVAQQGVDGAAVRFEGTFGSPEAAWELHSTIPQLTVGEDLPDFQNVKLQLHSATNGDDFLPLTFSASSPELDGAGRIGKESFRLTDLRMGALDFENKSGDVVFIVKGASGNGLWSYGSKILEFDISVQIKEMLFHSLYANLSRAPTVLTVHCDMQKGHCDDVMFQNGSLVTAQVVADWADEILLKGQVSLSDLEAFREHVQHPSLEQLPGTITGSARFAGNVRLPNLAVDGVISLDAKGMDTGDIQVEKIHVELPVIFDCHERSTVSSSVKTGRVWLKNLRSAFMHVPELSLNLRSKHNMFTSENEFHFSAFKKDFILKSIRFHSLCKQPKLDVSLAPFAHRLEFDSFVPFRITSGQQDIHISSEEVKFDGDFKVGVFGGEVQLSDVAIRHPFSSYRLFASDVDFHNIELERFSAFLGLGSATGIANGYAHSLEVVDGLPSRFDAYFESQAGGKISFEAINSISELSQGGSLGALQKGIYSLFDTYRYGSIAFSADLKNDVFSLYGKAKEGSDKYIIRSSLLPPRIDVVTHSHAIAFKEMMKRISRVKDAQ